MNANAPCPTACDRAGILEFPCGIVRLPDGHTLIADAGAEAGTGSELIEVTPAGEVAWRWNDKCRFLHGVKVLADGEILLADTTNNRILGIRRTGEIVFSSEDWGGGSGTLSDGTHLHYPNNIHPLDERLFMVTDRNHDRFVVVDRKGRVERSGFPGLQRPHNCEPLPGGGAIIANSDVHGVEERDAAGQVVWRFDQGLNWPRDANRLPNGHTLITDSRNSRVLEVNPAGTIVWSYQADYFANFYEAHRLPGGHTLVSDQQRQRVIEINPAGEIVWSFRNYRRATPLYERLTNGSFKQVGPDGAPESWLLGVRFAEGGGGWTWGQDRRGRRIPGLAYDRNGGVYAQQSVKVQPGAFYTLGGMIGTTDLDGNAFFQVAFTDEYDALLCDASQAPRGESFSGTTELTQDSFEVVAPPRAAAAQVRVFMTGRGKVFFDQVRFFA